MPRGRQPSLVVAIRNAAQAAVREEITEARATIAKEVVAEIIRDLQKRPRMVRRGPKRIETQVAARRASKPRRVMGGRG